MKSAKKKKKKRLTRQAQRIYHFPLGNPKSRLTDCGQIIYIFENEGIFVQLDELVELDKFTHAWIRIHLQFHTSTKDNL